MARDLAETRSPLRLGGRSPRPEGGFWPRLGPKGPLANTGRPNTDPFHLQTRQNEPKDDKIGEDRPLWAADSENPAILSFSVGPGGGQSP